MSRYSANVTVDPQSGTATGTDSDLLAVPWSYTAPSSYSYSPEGYEAAEASSSSTGD